MYLRSWSETGKWIPPKTQHCQKYVVHFTHLAFSQNNEQHIFLLTLSFNSRYSTKMLLPLEGGCNNKCVPSIIHGNQLFINHVNTGRQPGTMPMRTVWKPCQWESHCDPFCYFEGIQLACGGSPLLVGFSRRAPVHTPRTEYPTPS